MRRKPKRALIFGRFQPFHKGHLAITRWALENGFEEIVYLVGMASENYTPRNPFTAGERIEMIRLSLMDEDLGLERFITATIRTLETSIGSVYYVLSYVPRVDAILTRNPVIGKIFEDAGIGVIKPPVYNRDEWRGERIRELMSLGDPRWMNAVTRSTAEYILSIGGIERLRHALAKD
ncbi:MAG: nicotinamide-nucleotide adenylyltransferase [Desulfurococcales archaeon]|nr:nicotinamide-nucleotide adenylyltransferase [Desulfurococcales archaeon]MEB3806633.1 nicotinamide-nucleotide adenylyltransferase [Desulfurococcales archaeon]